MPPLDKHYEYVVIGAGSAGITVGTGLAKVGKRVLIVAKDVGGECTHTGCIPSKTFLSLAMHYLAKSHKRSNEELRADIFPMIRKKVNELEKVDWAAIEDSGATFVEGAARFVGHDTIEIREAGKDGKQRRVTFGNCVVATGSHPQVIDIPGVPPEKILTNESLFRLKELPRRIVIFGGGPIGTENGTAMAKFGVDVTLVVRSGMIPVEPRETVAVVKDSLRGFGAKIYENVKSQEFDPKRRKLILRDEGGASIAELPEADYYMMALGRLPNVDGLELGRAGIAYDERGIEVDDDFRTTNPHVYAIGDVLDGPKFTHLAHYHAVSLIRRAVVPFLGRTHVPLPAVTYSDPPIASVGDLRESETTKKFVLDFDTSDRALVEEVKGMKGVFYVDMLTGKIRGVSMVGHFAEHAINFATLAVQKRLSVFDMGDFMVPYPTYFSGIEKLYPAFLAEWSTGGTRYWAAWFRKHAWQLVAIAACAGLLVFLGYSFPR
jgi:pyruvate/2-oxoglutarate dehydrogenase complex dihydrolipoamide dehydrogenase (E3) component